MIGDWPVTGTRVDEKTYSDVSDDVFELEKMFEREERGWSPVRSVNQFVVESGERLGVKTYIVVPPLTCTLLFLFPFMTMDSGPVGGGEADEYSRARNWLFHARLWAGAHDGASSAEEETGCHGWCRFWSRSISMRMIDARDANVSIRSGAGYTSWTSHPSTFSSPKLSWIRNRIFGVERKAFIL
jgi:hypothetical protein